MKRILKTVLSTVFLLSLIIPNFAMAANNPHHELFTPSPNAKANSPLSAYSSFAKIPNYFNGRLGIGVYNTPPTRLANTYFGFEDNEAYADTAYAEIATFGANFAWGFWWDTSETEAYLLDICEKYGLKFIGYADLGAYVGNFSNPSKRDAMVDYAVDWIKNIADHPALIGFEIQDEPMYDMFETVAAVREAVEANMPANKFAIANLSTGWDNSAYLGGVSYDEYVEEYISMAKPKMLYFDDYPLMAVSSNLSAHQSNMNRYIRSLSMISQSAREHKIPFGGYLQATKFDMDGLLRQPDCDEMKWQANMQIAFGAKSITWYGYSAQSVGNHEFDPDDPWPPSNDTYMRDVYGALTPAWYDAQKVNLALKQFDQSYIDFTHMGLIPVNMGDYTKQLRNMKLYDSYAGIKTIQTTGMMLNGCFEHEDGRKGIYLYNFSLDNPLNTVLSLNGLNFELWGENGLEYSDNDTSLTISLGVGEAKFLVFERDTNPPADETTSDSNATPGNNPTSSDIILSGNNSDSTDSDTYKNETSDKPANSNNNANTGDPFGTSLCIVTGVLSVVGLTFIISKKRAIN